MLEFTVRATLLAVSVCLAGIVGVVLRGRDTYLWSLADVAFLVALPGAISIICFSSLVARRPNRLAVFVGLIASVVSLVIGEIAVAILDTNFGGAASVDSRTKLDRVMEERARGVDAVPALHPINLFEKPLLLDGTALLPMAGVGDAYTIFCNEIGIWYDYQSDRFGFINPQQTWSVSPISIAILGDSFAQGACIPNGGSFAELIRSRYPATLNLGNQGDGPLLSLATLREYLPAVRPQRVLWFFFEGNDIDDLSKELNQPILSNYYRDLGFSQNLASRADLINSALRAEIESRIERELNPQLQDRWAGLAKKIPEFFGPVFKLWHIRNRLGLVNFSNKWSDANFNPLVTKEQVEAALEKIFAEAKSRIADWGGELIVVYLPAQENFMRAGKLVPPSPWRGKVLNTLRHLGIKVIDIYPLVVGAQDPLQYFPFRRGGWGHYSREGNSLVANTVISELESPR